jgi:dTDP-D-glucose 4,6-dehydratase
MAVYLVTGAAGFIGANYVHFLLGREPEARGAWLDLQTQECDDEGTRITK